MPHLEPTYLRYIYDGLNKGSIHPENSAELPDGLIGMYEEAFEERKSVIERQKLLQRFAIWALLKKEVSAAFVAEVVGESEDDIQEFISTYSAWFNSPESGKYQLYHERLKVYLLQKLSEGEIHTLHEKLIGRLEKAIETQKADEFEWYGLEYLAGHLGVSGIINEDKRLFKYGRRANFESRQIEVSEGFEWSKSLYKNCIETSTISNKENVIEWGIKLHLINQAEQKDWSLVNRHFDLGEISRFESELEEKINQFSFVSDNYLSYPTLLTYAYYFRLIENESIQRLHKERLFDLLNKSVEKHAIDLFDFPRLHLVIIEQFHALGFDVSFLIKRFNFQMSSGDAQKCLLPSDFLLHGVYDNIYCLFKTYEINEGDFLKTFLHIGFKYSTENIDEIIGRIGLLNFDKSIIETRIKEDLNPLYLIDILTNAVEKDFDSFLSAEKLNWNEKKLYDIIEFALLNDSFFKTNKWEQLALKYLRKSDDFDYRAINLLNLIKKISDRDLIKIGLLSIKTNQDSLVSVFFGYLVKHNKVWLIKTIIDKIPNHSTNLTLWNFLLENKFNLELLFESSLIESKELKRIWLVNTIRYFRKEVPTSSFLEFCQYSENASVNIDQETIKFDCWIPETLMTRDFNNNIGVTYYNHKTRLNSENNLEFVLLWISNSDVCEEGVEQFLHIRIQELLDSKKTGLNYESVKATFSFLLKYSRRLYDFYFEQLLNYLNSLTTNEKHLNSLSFIYEFFQREGFKYEDVRLTDFFYNHFVDSKIPRHPDTFGDLIKLPLTDQQKKNIYKSYVNYSWTERRENINLLTSLNYFNELLIDSSLSVFENVTGELIHLVLNYPWDYCEFIESSRNTNNLLEKIQKIIYRLPGYPWDQLVRKEIITTYSKLFSTFNSKDSLERFLNGTLMSSLITSNEYEEFAFHYKLNSKKSREKSIDKLKSPYFADNPEYYRGELSSLINISLDDRLENFEERLPNYIIKPKNYIEGVKAIQWIIKSIFPLESLNSFLFQCIDKYIANTFETLFGYIMDSSIKSEAEEEDFEKAIEDLADSENIVLLLYCSLLIQISDKKHEKKVELIKKVIQELVKAGYYDFSEDFEEYTEYEGDLIFLCYNLVTAYNSPSNSSNKLLYFMPLRTKFIFIFSELLKKESVVSSKEKKSALGFIDYCLSKKLSIQDLIRLYEASTTIGSMKRAKEAVRKIITQIEFDEDIYMNLRDIFRLCISYKDKFNLEILMNRDKYFSHLNHESIQTWFESQGRFNDLHELNKLYIEAEIILHNFSFSNYLIINPDFDDCSRIEILIKLSENVELSVTKNNILPELDLHLTKCVEVHSELHEDYLVEIGCILYKLFGVQFSKNYVFERNTNLDFKSFFISELILKNQILDIDDFIIKGGFLDNIIHEKFFSKILGRQNLELQNMKKIILEFYNLDSEKCLKQLISKRAKDKNLFFILSNLKLNLGETMLLKENLRNLQFSITNWIHIIGKIPAELREDFVNELIRNKKSQISVTDLNLFQEYLSISISQEIIFDLVTNYAEFKQWKKIDRILKWLKTQQRIQDIQDVLTIAYDKNWEIKTSVFLNLLGKTKSLNTLHNKTNFVNANNIDSIERISEIPRQSYHVHPDYFEKIRNDLDRNQITEIIDNIKSRTTEAGNWENGWFSNLYWTRMNATEINRYISIYYNNKEALELLVSNFKIISELEDEKEYSLLLNQFDVNYAKFDVEL